MKAAIQQLQWAGSMPSLLSIQTMPRLITTSASAANPKAGSTKPRTPLAKATTLDPDFPDAHFAQANVLAALGKLNAAIRHTNTATKLKPNWAEAYNNWGNYLFDLDRHEDAVEKYGHALSMDQDNMNCRVNRGLALLTLGNLEAGWEAYRVRGLSDAPYYRASGKELTAGKEDFEGKDVLVGNEQGLGDEILYAGMLEECAQLTRTCTFACSKKLFSF